MASSLLGVPDVGLVTQSEIIDVARRIKQILHNQYFIVDGDTGFGGKKNIKRLIADLHSIQASAVTLEDQQMPKKCGHMPVQHHLVSTEQHIKRIDQAYEQREKLNAKIDIIARTDIRNYGSIEDVIARSHAYSNAGADIIFLEAIKNEDEFKIIRGELLGIKLLANIPESSNKTELINLDNYFTLINLSEYCDD